MKYMVIETILQGALDAVYQRFKTHGRLLPEGLFYCDSWLEENGSRCFQLMQTDNPDLFLEWIKSWDDLVEFEIIPLGDKP